MSQLASIHLAKTGRAVRVEGSFASPPASRWPACRAVLFPNAARRCRAAAPAQATVLGIPNERFFPALGIDPLEAEFVAAMERQVRARGLKSLADMPQLQLLAISGGGENGAFGAGLLCGWSAQGTRPTFDLVTGISTGALTAPFAFLGPDYDPQLRAVYTETPPARDPDQALRSRPRCSTMPWPTTSRCSGPSRATSTTACWRASPRPTIRGACC